MGQLNYRLDVTFDGREAEVSGSDSLRAAVTVCGETVERSLANLAGDTVAVRVSDEAALGFRMDGELISAETPLPERMDAPMPEFDLPGGEYTEARTLCLSPSGGDDAGTVIHYTTDGSEPTEDSPVYVLPIPVNRSMTVRAIACKFGYRDSMEVRMDYEFPYMAAPVADVPGGHYVDTQAVTLSGEGAIYYTLDGSDPALYGEEYALRLVIGRDTVLRAVRVDENGVAGEELMEEYTFTRTWSIDTAVLFTDENGEATAEFSEASKITFTLSSYMELERGKLYMAYYDAAGRFLDAAAAELEFLHDVGSATLPVRDIEDVAEIKVFFCDEDLVPLTAVYFPMNGRESIALP